MKVGSSSTSLRFSSGITIVVTSARLACNTQQNEGWLSLSSLPLPSPFNPHSLQWSSLWSLQLAKPAKQQGHLCLYTVFIITFPVSETSPVIAMLSLIGLLVAKETSAETMVMPALGPSLGVAPSGTCKWMGVVSRKVLSGCLSPRKVYN